MGENKREQIKIYIVIGLALVAAILGYFRFLHKKATHDVDRTPSTVSIAEFNVPHVKIETPQNAQLTELPVNESLRPVIRDIFSPLKSPIKRKGQPAQQEREPPKPLPSLKLMGTIVGGKRPIAIINDRLVRTGDWIGEYRVVSIAKDEVLLSSDSHQMVLEVLKSVEK